MQITKSDLLFLVAFWPPELRTIVLRSESVIVALGLSLLTVFS
jgi:hypothetical protein